MAERPEDLNLPNAVITRIIKEAVGAGPAAQRSGALEDPAPGGPGLLTPRPREILAPGDPGPWPELCPGPRGSALGCPRSVPGLQHSQQCPEGCSTGAARRQRSSCSGTGRNRLPKTSAYKSMFI